MSLAWPGSSSWVSGVALTLLSYLLWSAHYATAKALGSGYSAWQLIFVRSLGVLALVGMSSPRRWPELSASFSASLPRLVAKGVCQLASAWCFFHAASGMSLGTVTVLYSSAPIVVLLLSPWVLQERVAWSDALAVAVGLAGVLVALPPTGSWVPERVLAALLSGFFWGLTVVLSRRWSDHGSTSAQLITSSLLFAGLSALAMDFRAVATWRDVALFALLALEAYGAQWLFFEACKRTPAKVMGPLEYSSIVWALLMGWLAFGERPDAPLLCGAALVGLSGCLASRSSAASHS